MNEGVLRQVHLSVAVMTVVVLLASDPAVAQTRTALATHFTATAINLERVSGETVTVHIQRWSTEAERDQILSALADKGPAQVDAVLRKLESVGSIWRSGSGLGYLVRYAWQAKLPDGKDRIVIATDRDLSDWSTYTSDSPTAQPEGSSFTLIEVRVPPAGTGEGKMSISAKVVRDSLQKILTLENYEGAPVVLQGVKLEGT